jgi:ABC-2 type transport system ATP-binding protein
LIHVKDLSKNYGNFQALSEISFHAEKGEILGFLGPNGAGKTTTMRILTGYISPSTGTVEVAGFDLIEDSLEVRKRTGYMPETVPVYPELSAREYLTFMGSLRRVPDLDDRVDTALEEVGLQARADSYAGNLSKGLRQRLGLAQALLHRPEVLILDEPTIGLDPAQIIEVRDLIRQVGADRTVLLSTHILSEAQQVCDRVLIINQGHIVAEDTPNNLQAQLAGAERIRVRTSSDTELLAAVLAELDVIEELKPIEGGFEVAGHPGRDIRPVIARAIVEAGLDLIELSASSLSLERIFLQLTQEQNDLENSE